MATYKEIKGVTIQTLDSDPVLNVNSWSSGGSMTTDRARMAGDGPQTAFITFGGTTPSPGTQLANTETYDGTSFTETGDLSLGRTDLAGAGTTTATLAVAGSAGTGLTNTAEAFGGSSWTSSPSCNTARYQLAGFGTQTNMVIAGGLEPGFSNKTEEWNGSSWTEKNELNTARQGLNSSGAGVYTAGIIAGGRKAHPSNPGQESNDTETWNGTSWTEVNELNEAKQLGGVFGTSTSAIYAGGADTATLAAVESWDGSSWSETSDLATARYYVSSGGASGTSGIIAGGTPGAATEEWSLPPPTSAILNEGMIFLSGGTTLKGFGKAGGIPAGVFSSASPLNTPRERFGGTTFTGGSTAAIGAGGDSPTIDSVEQYDGSSWSEITDLNTARGGNGGGAGTTTAMLAFSGGPSITDVVESWNGSAWTEVAEVNTGRYESKGGGTQTAALFYPGYLPPPGTARNNFEEWDGSSWTELADINRARSGIGAGTTSPSAAVIFAGSNPPPVPSPTPADASTETWNGTSWTEVNEMNTGRSAPGSFGTSTSCIAASGYSGGFVENVEIWNGTSWTEINSMGTDGSNLSASGNTTAALVFGGNPQPGRGTLTEEWVVESVLSTVTVS